MRRHGLLWLALGLPRVAAAGDAVEPTEAGEPAPEEPPPPANEEIVVFGSREVARRRQLLDNELRRQGYKAGIHRDDRVVYRPETPWHPTVVVYDDGFVVLKRSPVRFEPPIDGRSNLRYLACIPPFTPMCFRIGGQVVSQAKLAPAKARVAEGIDDESDAWQSAIASTAMRYRIETALPAELDALWTAGEPFEPGPLLPTPDERRAAILAFWASRADTPEGDAVRDAVELFLSYEVQSSPFAAGPDELAAASSACRCGRDLAERLAPPTDDAPDTPASGPSETP